MSSNETSADINTLQQQLAQQQEKITALREMVRKSDNGSQGKSSSSATTEKVKNISKQLTQLKAKAQGSYYSGDVRNTTHMETEAEINPIPVKIQQQQRQLGIPQGAVQSGSSVSSSGSEKVLLLRQQMEENKLRLAQRASSKLHLEQLVSELKEKLDSTQQSLDDTSELGKSMTDLSIYSNLTRSGSTVQSTTVPSGTQSSTTTPAAVRREQRHRSATDLSSQPAFNLEKERIKFLENRCRLLEKQLEKERHSANNNESVKQVEIDLTEQQKRNKELDNRILELERILQEHQHEIEKKTINENDLAKENERLRQELKNKQENPKDEESDSEANHFENEKLRNEVSLMAKRIKELEEINDVLETTRCDLSSANREYEEKLQQLEEELKIKEEKLENLQAELNAAKEKESEMEIANVGIITEATESQIRTELVKQVQELQELNRDLNMENKQFKESLAESENSQINDEQIKAKINNLEASIESLEKELNLQQETNKKLEEELMEKTIELNVSNANFRTLEEKLQSLSKTKSKPLFSSASMGEGANADNEAEIQQLKQKLDESNKAMIKLKLKCKQSEKQMEKLKKSSNLHEELVELQKTNEQLQQRITELEDEKGQWQLKQMESSTDSREDEEKVDLNKTQGETIRLLEQQKYEQLQQMEFLQEQLESLREKSQNQERVVIARVESELSEVQLEEQLDKQKQEINSLRQQLEAKETSLSNLQQQIEEMQLEKQALEKKLDHYITENMELLDKVEKLSKSSSSAESIEIVDRLTQQERAEMDEFNQRLQQGVKQQKRGAKDDRTDKADVQHPTSVNELTQTEMGYELSESLVKLREESSELMEKVAMFTTERREVLEKMEHLTNENHDLQQRLEDLTEQKQAMEHQLLEAEETKNKLEIDLQDLTKEKELLSTQIAESNAQRSQLTGELTSMQKSSEIVAALDDTQGCVTLFEKCEKSLSKLETELEAYRRANDKNSKFNASKKLAKEAKNAHTQLSELLQKVKEASSAVETVTVVETVVAVTAPNGKALAEYEQLTAQNRELKSTVEDLRRKLEEIEDSHLHHGTISDLEGIKPAETRVMDEGDLSLKDSQLEEALKKLRTYEEECLKLKTTVDELQGELKVSNLANEAKTGELNRLKEEIKELRKISSDFEELLNNKEMSHEMQLEKFTKLRQELEGKCEVYEGEMEILQTLVAEQKQQLIEAYKEHEHEMNLKLLDLQQRDEQISTLRTELTELRQASRAAGAELSDNLEKECEKLREALRINKALSAEQINELANKQETIDMLNQQIIELYKTMEENSNKVIEKEDEIADLEAEVAKNNSELERLKKDNEEQKSVVDKLLNELHSYKENKQQIVHLENEISMVTKAREELKNQNADLEKRNKEQLEKMKKFAANLKKKVTQCQELEEKIKSLESKSKDNELQQELSSNVVLLNERIIDYEYKIRTQEAHIHEIQEALQTKTIEVLESMESNEHIEKTMQDLRNELEQRNNEIVQLKNALAASQEEAISKNAWDDSAFEENAEQLAKVQGELLEARELLMTKDQALSELKEEVQYEVEKRTISNQQILDLQKQTEDFQTKIKDLQIQIESQEQQLKRNEEELKARSLKFEKSKAVIKERNNHIHRLQAQVKELQEKLATQPEEVHEESFQIQIPTTQSEPKKVEESDQFLAAKSELENLQKAYENLNTKYINEKATFEQTIAKLETLHDGIQAKLQEDMSYIETLEQENSRFKDKICRLEECVNTFEERRSSMERRANLLDAQMQSRTDEYVKAEDELIYRLNMLSEHDEVIGQRLLDSQEEKEALQERLDSMQRQFSELTAEYNKIEKDYKNFKEQNETQHEIELQQLKSQLESKKEEIQRLTSTWEVKLAAKTSEIDELENDLSDQLARMNMEKRSMQEELEKSRDNCSALKDEIMHLNESLNAVEQAKQESERELTWLRMQNDNAEQDQYELQELRMQSLQDKTELDNLRQQIETLASNHQAETDALRLQIAELDSLRMQVGQNQTDDQVFIESENKRLSDLLNEKEAIISEYQRQNLQLQMAAAAVSNQASIFSRNSAQTSDFFSSDSAVSQQGSASLNLEQELAEKTALISRLQSELESLRDSNSSSQRQVESNVTDSLQLEPVITPMTSSANDIIIAPPTFFAANEAIPSPFDEIVERRQENHQLGATAAGDAFIEQPTIEDLQRNVSDLEKHAQELEHKLVAKNNVEEDLRQRLNETRSRQVQAEQEHLRSEEQLQVTRKRLQEFEQLQQDQFVMQTQMESRISQLKTLLKEREDEIQAQNFARAATYQAEEIEKRLREMERSLQFREAEIAELQHQLEMERKLNDSNKTLEGQIVASEAEKTDIFKREVAPTLDMFFGNSTAPGFEDIIVPSKISDDISTEPVVEEVIKPEKAYICYPKDDANPSTAFNIDDAWGSDDGHWGANEAAAEAKHFAETANSPLRRQTSSLLSKEQELELQLQAANERVKDLESSLGESENQKQKLQEKLAKTMKVVSKYKNQNEELKKKEQGSTGGGFFDDLDAAIQDELKNQIKKLEADLEEHLKIQREASIEKEKLLKRIDVLTAGNERMSEMKERQDMDMQMYKTRISELQQKLSKLEDWDAENEEAVGVKPSKISEPSIPSDSKMQELEAQLKTLKAEVEDLNGDKQELQAILEEEKANVARAEHNQQESERKVEEISKDYAKVCEEMEELRRTHAELYEVNGKLLKEIDELKRYLEDTQTKNEELRKKVSELESQSQNQSQIAEERKQHETEKENLLKEKALIEATCREQQNDLEKLRIELANVSSSLMSSQNPEPKEFSQATAMALEEMSVKLQEKDAEIVHLKQRIEDLMREDQTEKLVLEILTKNQEIHMLKMQVKHLEDDKQELEHNLTLQITKEMQEKSTPTDEINKEEEIQVAKEKIQQLEAQLQELQNEKIQMEEELSVLNAHVMNSLEIEDKLKAAALDLDTKNIEIKELRQSLEVLRNDKENEIQSSTSTSSPHVDITALNAQWESLVEQKCSEIAQMWRTHLDQRESEFQATEHRLKAEIELLQKTQNSVHAQASDTARTISHPQAQPLHQQPSTTSGNNSGVGSTTSTPVSTVSATTPTSSSEASPLHIINEAEADEIIAKMQSALESQEMEIVSLKEQLAIRSAEYARLAAQYDPFKLQGSSGSEFSPRAAVQRGSDGTTTLVPKSQLDLALYMLHQRDMRCEEMTVELVALLEERDTLQLKLSNTLRQVEAIKTQTNFVVEPPQIGTDATSTTSLGSISNTSITDSPTKTLSTTGIDDSADELNQKLSQLQTVNHSKDKVFKEERERRLREMERIHQDVAKIPTAAVSELIGSDISQSSQSPSSALLNWLWGNKPPGGDNGAAPLN